MRTIPVITAFSILWVLAFGQASAGDTRFPERLILSASLSSLTVDSRYVYLRDPGGRLDIREVSQGGPLSWHMGDRSPLYLPSTDDVIWVRLDIESGPDSPPDWVLNIDWPFFDLLELYLHDPVTGRWETAGYFDAGGGEGTLAVFRDLPYAFGFSCPAGEGRHVYLRAHANGKLLMPIQLWQEDAFRVMGLYRHLLLGMFFGILVVMVCYNTSLFLFTKDDGYAYYSVYVFSIILYTMGMTGVGQAYIWGRCPWILVHSYGLFSSFSFLMAALFIRRFLSLPQVGGWLLHLSTAVVAFWIVMTLLFAASDAGWLILCEDLGAVVSCFLGLATAIILWARGSISAKYLTIAWTLLILATFVLMMGLTGIIDYRPLVQHSQNIGFTLEVVLLSIALAERINRERSEKEAAQDLSVKLHRQASESRTRELEAQAKILEVERATKAELRRKVEVRTRELRETLSALESANEVLDQLSRTDGLTRVANRRHFDAVLDTEFRRARRQNQPLSVILGDIDHFKAVNDTYGHPAGDECLQAVASTWKAQMSRAGELVARYGGEEFAAILPGTGTDDAVQVAERIRGSIQKITHTHNGQAIPLTISLGVASLSFSGDDDPAKLLERVDDALYRAKESGRNRVVPSGTN